MEPDYATTTKTWLYSVQLDGSGSSEVELNLGLDESNGGYINEIFAGPNGSIYLAYQNWVSTDTDSYTQVTLYSVDLATGSIQGDPIDLTAAMESAGFNRNETYINTIDYSGNELVVTIDGNIITGKGPAATLPYSYAILEMLGAKDAAEALREGMVYNYLMETKG